MQIGVIAEENNDVEVLHQLTNKLAPGTTFSFKKFVGHGCGKVRRKCAAWARNLVERGCSHLVLLHDLDQNDQKHLYAELNSSMQRVGFHPYVILIPVHEIEAWLLYDAKAIQCVFNMKKPPRLPNDPESVLRPKERLRDIVWKESRKRYVNTIHNGRIAAACRISRLRACHSFQPYPQFIARCN